MTCRLPELPIFTEREPHFTRTDSGVCPTVRSSTKTLRPAARSVVLSSPIAGGIGGVGVESGGCAEATPPTDEAPSGDVAGLLLARADGGEEGTADGVVSAAVVESAVVAAPDVATRGDSVAALGEEPIFDSATSSQPRTRVATCSRIGKRT
jgi:hypothetical protein